MVNYPADWEAVKLKDIGHIQMCRRIFQKQTKKSGDIPFFKISTFGKNADSYISRELFQQYKTRYPYPDVGDILLSTAGTIGRTVIFDGKNSYFQDSNIVWLKVDKNIVNRKFLWWIYRSFPWQGLEGTTIQRLYNKIILNTEIYLPTLREQQAIADTLSTFDTYISNLTELIEKKKAIREGALEDLVSGNIKLNGESINWEKVTLNEVAYYGRERINIIKNKYISTENMKHNFGGIHRYKENSPVSSIKFKASDILMANIRPYLKKIWFADFTGGCSADVLVIKGHESINSKLLYYILANERFINFVMNGGVKGIKMPRGDKNYIMQYEFLFPKRIQDQQAIADALTVMDDEIRNLETELDKMKQIREGAMDDLLTGRIRLPL